MRETEIRNLEQQLLSEEVRKSADMVSELLADSFTEFCSSGGVYHYTKGDTFGHGRERDWEIDDFEAKELGAGVVLATYRLTKHDEADETKRVSLRSSVWKFTEGGWKMVFHQGTPCRP
jgi:hypothetical protein